jgi:energy-coupling factor transporter ATP-binding protein EcfA2
MLKEVWEREQFKSNLPLDSSLVSKHIPGDDSGGIWLLAAPCFMGFGWVTWLKHCQGIEEQSHSELEAFKSTIKITSVSHKNEREFKTGVINNRWNDRKVEAGLISIDALHDRFQKQQELQDLTHEATKEQFAVNSAQNRQRIAQAEMEAAMCHNEANNIESGKFDKVTLPKDEHPPESLSGLPEQYQWMKQILKQPFSVISGEQGSGKSTLERLLIKLLKEMGFYVVIINPETTRGSSDEVLVLNQAETINEFVSKFPQMIRDRQRDARQNEIDEDDYLDSLADKKGLNGRVAVFLMESNTYEVHGVDAKLYAAFLKQSLTNIRKWGFEVFLTAHSANQTSISSELKGYSGLINSMARVDCVAKQDTKTLETVATGKAILRLKGVNDQNPVEVDLMHYKPATKEY